MAIDLTTLQRQRTLRPPRIVLYGPPKIGKTSFVAEIPDSVLLDVEQGSDNIMVAKFPVDRKLASFDEGMEFIYSLYEQPHNFKALGIDTADWFEKLIFAKVAADHGKNSIEDIPYGAGYAYAIDYWRQFLEGLDMLRNHKNMAIVLIAHAETRVHNDPMGATYDIYIPKLHGKTTKGETALGIMTEWCDALLFANYKVYTATEEAGFDKKKKIKKAVSSERKLFTSSDNPAYRAGNRYNLPAELPFTWSAFNEAFINSINNQQGV